MDTEDSRFLLFVRDRLNASTLAGERLELHEVVDEALYDVDVIGDERRTELSKSISRRVKSRAEHSVAIRNKIEKAWGQVLAMFDECIATAEELNAGFMDNLRSSISCEEVDRSSVRRYGSDQLLGGATLKILLLAGLQGTMTQRVSRRCYTSNHTTATPRAWAGSGFETKILGMRKSMLR